MRTESEELLALSFLQPWLWAILEEHKGIRHEGRFYALENRTWKPPRFILGRTTALHASRGWDEDGQDYIDGMLGEALGNVAACVHEDPTERGAILGTARVIGAVRKEGARAEVFGGIVDALADAAAASPWSFGPWIWLLTDLRELRRPVPASGARGLWRVPTEIAARVRDAGVVDGR